MLAPTERFAQIANENPKFMGFAGGHTMKVLRYINGTTKAGLAIEKRKGAPMVWIDEGDYLKAGSPFSPDVRKPRGRFKRNSNLVALFGENALVGLRPTDDAAFLAALDCVS